MEGLILANRYEIIEKIGEGGMAFVYKARDLKLNRLVAIKILKSEFATDKNFLTKFKDEAMSAASINDSNIVNMYDVGSEDSINYIVMEYIDGKTLKDLINEKVSIPYKEAIDIAVKIAKALDSAHKNNIVHRDIKPHNILVTEKGDVKVADFGIAKGNSSATIVNTNKVVGSVHYISPEQAKGSIVDRRSDLYSLGVVIYEMVTGRLPFDAESPVSIAVKHIQDSVIEPRKFNKDIPESLNYLILKALEKDPLLRYQNAHELYIDLLNIKNGTFVFMRQNNNENTILMKPIDETMLDIPKDKFKKIENEDDEVDNVNNEDDRVVSNNQKVDNKRNSKKNNPKKAKKFVLVTVAVLAFIILAAGSIYIGGLFAGSNAVVEVKVPDVVNLTESEAKKSIEDSGLVYEVAETNNNELEAGKIYASNPTAGTNVKKGSIVKVYVSSGKAKNRVGTYTNLSVNDAKTKIVNDGFIVGSIDQEYSDTVDANKVISQSETQNTELEAGSAINLVISKGTKVLTYNLIGKTIDEAKKMLNGSGVSMISKTKESSSDSDKDKDGKIVEQDKTSVIKGDAITVTVIKYTEPTITIDSSKVVNGALSEVKSYITGLGLTVEVTYTDDASKKLGDSKLYVQSFSPTTGVKKGDKITLTVAAKNTKSSNQEKEQ